MNQQNNEVVGQIQGGQQHVAPSHNGDLEAKEHYQCDVLVIGGGPGGYTAAFRAADLGKKVIIVNQYPTLGGVCLNVGCIPSKSLLHIANVINEVKELVNHGIMLHDVQFDTKKIADHKNEVISKLTTGLSMLAKKRQVQVVAGMAKFVGANQVAVYTTQSQPASDNQPLIAIATVSFSYAIIAVGSHAFTLPHLPNQDKRIMGSTSALALQDIPAKLLIVGAGIIGLEMAQVYSALGSKITIVELGKEIMVGADRDVVKVLEKRISKIYDKIYTSTNCQKVVSKEDGLYVTLTNTQDGAVVVDSERFDKILVAAGRRPNGNTIDAHKANVLVNDKGFIAVNNRCQTNVAHIYAIGDVVGEPMLAHKATHEAKIAAQNIAGLKSFFDARVIPAVAYTDPEVAWVGVTEDQAKKEGRKIAVGKFPWAASGRALANGRSDGLSKIIVDANSHKIIGASIVGVNAGELLAEACLAIEMGCDIHDVALTIHAHPTLSESIALACEIIDGSITDL